MKGLEEEDSKYPSLLHILSFKIFVQISRAAALPVPQI